MKVLKVNVSATKAKAKKQIVAQVPPDDYDLLHLFGGGNISRGLRELIGQTREEMKKAIKTKGSK
jgi:hypothetical protein